MTTKQEQIINWSTTLFSIIYAVFFLTVIIVMIALSFNTSETKEVDYEGHRYTLTIHHTNSNISMIHSSKCPCEKK